MTINFVSTKVMTTSLTAGIQDQVYVTTEGSILATSIGIASLSSGDNRINATVHGTVAGGSFGIYLNGTDDESEGGQGNNTVFVGQTGIVQGIRPFALAVSFTGFENTITNLGQVLGSGYAVFFNEGNGHRVENLGSIISTLSNAINFAPTPDYTPVPGSSDVRNSGYISGVNGIFSQEGDVTVTNSGRIIGETEIGINIQAGTQGSIIANSGTIRGASTAIVTGSGDDEVSNSGVIDGNIFMNSGGDVFDGRQGTVNGTVYGGAGDDTYIVDDKTLTLSEANGEGTDLVISETGWRLGDNFENLTLIGNGNIRGVGNDLDNEITGNMGANRLRGKAGDDTLNGAGGNDKLKGNRGDDQLNGGSGDDILRGNLGNDTLSGGDGDDRLIGGKGKDALTGGEGEDVFVFNRVGHSLKGVDFDTVSDFQAGEDRIDLSGLNLDLKFIGTSGLSGTGDAEVRLRVTGAKTTVQVDQDGDGTYDMRIDLTSSFGLTEADFIL